MPKISMVIPVFNTEEYLVECLESILLQPYSDYEIILVDDGSTDGSLSICEEYAAKYSNISAIHLENNGPSIARNTGMLSASGQYIMFIDSDDTILNDCLIDIDKVINDTNADIIIGHFETFYEDKTRKINDCILDREFINGQPQIKILEYISSKNYLYTVWRHIFKRELIEKNNLLFYQGIYHEDEEWVPRLLCAAESFWLIEKPYYCYKVRSTSIMGKTTLKHNIDKLIAAESLYLFSQDLPLPIGRFAIIRAFRLFTFALYEYKNMSENDQYTFYEYIIQKKSVLLPILESDIKIKNLLLLLVPFFEIFYPDRQKMK